MRHIIIGVGAAGITAARTIRECDKEAQIVMVSQDTYVHSRCMLHKYLSGERDEKAMSFVPEDFFQQMDITWIKGKKVTEILAKEHAILLEDGTNLVYDRLLITTGANSFIPPVGDFRKASNVFGLRHLQDAQDILQLVKPDSKILIVGSGLVGMDAAYAFLEKKMDVTVVEMADRILPIQLDEKAGSAYKDLFEQAGCKFILSKKASQTVLSDEGTITEVILDDGTSIPCDVIIVAAGVRPAMECSAAAGINGERAITVDPYMKCSEADIYAAGDVTGLSGIWPNAMKQGQTAAYNMCDMPVQYLDTYAMKNTINFFGLTTLSLGRGQAEEGDQVIICEEQNNYRKAIIRNGKLDSILLQGSLDYAGIYQYLIKNQIDISEKADKIFKLSFADYYGILPDGQYEYVI